MKKKIATVAVQKSGSNEYINLPKSVREIFNIAKGDNLQVSIDTATNEITLKKTK